MKAFVVLLGLVFSVSMAKAWGPIGHSVVGQIAESHLTLKAKAEIKELLNNQSLADAANWADEIRKNKDYAHADTWHYVTVPNGQTYQTSKKNPKGDVIEALARMEKILTTSKNKKERAEALKFLIHFVGDLHQPLHVGREDDRGANECRVLFFNDPSNLHAVWDSKMIERLRKTYYELADELDRNKGKSGPTEATNFVAWATESQTMRETIYPKDPFPGLAGGLVASSKASFCSAFTTAKDVGADVHGPMAKLGEPYFRENIGKVKQRLTEAGLRLASVLNQIFR